MPDGENRPRIQVLDKHTAELIAAGEVVERPASVVKELLENAVDAGATAVTVEIRRGGVELIRVQDNGAGMVREDVPTAFLRHATSKVRTETDLDAIGTLGFRGEALASIAAVSRVELLTCAAGETAGTRYVIEGGEEHLCEDAGFPQGTAFFVRDLFYNVPARMKFLKKDVSEANAVAGVVERLALSHPEIAFRFLREGREELVTPGDGSLRACIYAVSGRAFSESLLPVDYTLGGVRVHGFVSRPDACRANRAMQHFFVNGRYVKTRTAMAALEQACKGAVMTGKFPACVLHIELPPETVDANIHPAKIEVRFINEKPVFNAVYHGVQSALRAGRAPKPVTLPQREAASPLPSVPASSHVVPAVEKAGTPVQTTASFSSARMPVQPDRDGGGEGVRDLGPLHRPLSPSVPSAPPVGRRYAVDIFVEEAPPPAGPGSEKKHAAVEQPGPAPSEKESMTAQEGPVESLLEPVEPVVCLGEAFHTYLIAQRGEALYFIDKHAAHERLLYDQLRREGPADVQQLLTPLSLTLSREEYAVLLENREALEAAGFEIDDFGGGALLVRGIPLMLEGCDIAAAVEEIAGKLLSGRREMTPDRLDWIYASTACRAAVKAGDGTSPQERQQLAERVLMREDLRTCPHGRPVCFEITRRELEKQFGRIQ
ncbi:MAG: DNA mismatch repair endonuclease MutL [Clostridiales bacterium]|nr:DNA mismatch repair endonuclease MutL [Clostridiales bacterium]